jgi:hypothetical protein
MDTGQRAMWGWGRVCVELILGDQLIVFWKNTPFNLFTFQVKNRRQIFNSLTTTKICFNFI